MRRLLNISLLLVISCSLPGQDTVITISKAMKLPDVAVFPLTDKEGWFFKMGNDTGWADTDLDISDWQKFKPSGLTEKLADKNGKLECWFRIKIRLDSSFKNSNLTMIINGWAATDVYVNGILTHSFGNTGINGEPFQENPQNYRLPVPINLETGRQYVFAFHFVDYVSSFPPYRLKSGNWVKYYFGIADSGSQSGYLNFYLSNRFYRNIWLWVNIILSFLFWLLAFQNKTEKNILFIAITSTFFTLTIYTDQFIPSRGFSFATYEIFRIAWSIFGSLSIVLTILLLLRVFKRSVTLLLKGLCGMILLCGIIEVFYFSAITLIVQTALVILIYSYCIITSWKTLKGAQWAVLVGVLLSMSFGLSLAITSDLSPGSYTLALLLYTGLFVSFPLSLTVYVAMRFKEIIREVRDNAKQVVRLSEEKKDAAIKQQRRLEEEVAKQTVELRNSLENLKATQSQLIQSEKMASLGELTAGIAHEIQNPLNFVNNFSDLNKELLAEMKDEIDKGNIPEVKSIANDVIENEEKINHHGKRAEAIVKGMLQHSRTSSGQKEPTDINALADEYLRLAYHGFRAKDKAFNAKFETEFDKSINKINVVPQDIGRVLLNLINNAFYAVSEKRQQLDGSYEPTVSVSTRKLKDKVEVKVKDNGGGIPQKVLDKIFQPFFTTKPTGVGTGLGLSLSYDIVRAHGGEIRVETKVSEGTDFVLILPALF